MFAVGAPAPGTGKSLMVDIISIIGTGRVAARMTLPRSETELRKVILTIALEGAPAVLIDNVEGVLGSGTLAAALTAEYWEDRVLGVSKRARAPLRAVWFATGNGLMFKRDLGRRVIPIDMDAKAEHPEDRNGFTHPDLRRWTREHRPQLVVAAITLLRAYHLAGRPSWATIGSGSFEEWHAQIRGACTWIGLGDPHEGTARIRRDDDSDIMTLDLALQAWRSAFGETPVLAADAVTRSESDRVLRDALIALLGSDHLETAALGYALRRVKGRRVAGLWFERAGERRAGTRWMVLGRPVGAR
jgi:hypothetical protein